MLNRAWEASVAKALSGVEDIGRTILMDSNLFAVAIEFLFDRDPKHTFVCFGRFGGIIMGAATHAKIDSVVWLPDIDDVGSMVYRVNPTARIVVAVVDRMTGAGYPTTAWPQISAALSMTPTAVAEVRCLIDDRKVSGVRAMDAIEATQLIRVKSLARSSDA
jgi:hypothetical protein